MSSLDFFWGVRDPRVGGFLSMNFWCSHSRGGVDHWILNGRWTFFYSTVDPENVTSLYFFYGVKDPLFPNCFV